MRCMESGTCGRIQKLLVLHFPEIGCFVNGRTHALAQQCRDVGHGDVERVFAQMVERFGHKRGAQPFFRFPMGGIDVERQRGIGGLCPVAQTGRLRVRKAQTIEIGAGQSLLFPVKRPPEPREPWHVDRFLGEAAKPREDRNFTLQCVEFRIGDQQLRFVIVVKGPGHVSHGRLAGAGSLVARHGRAKVRRANAGHKKVAPRRGEARRNRASCAWRREGKTGAVRGLEAPSRVSGGQVTRAALLLGPHDQVDRSGMPPLQYGLFTSMSCR